MSHPQTLRHALSQRTAVSPAPFPSSDTEEPPWGRAGGGGQSICLQRSLPPPCPPNREHSLGSPCFPIRSEAPCLSDGRVSAQPKASGHTQRGMSSFVSSVSSKPTMEGGSASLTGVGGLAEGYGLGLRDGWAARGWHIWKRRARARGKSCRRLRSVCAWVLAAGATCGGLGHCPQCAA